MEFAFKSWKRNVFTMQSNNSCSMKFRAAQRVKAQANLHVGNHL